MRVPISVSKAYTILTQRHRILDLLEDLSRDYDELAKSGSYLTYRLALAKHGAEAKDILNVLAVCEAYRYKEDIV